VKLTDLEKTMKLLIAITSTALVCLSGCGEKHATESTASSESPRQETVFDSQLEALERAKAVDQQMKDAEERHRKAMQENGM
jgi:hypothetical protein